MALEYGPVVDAWHSCTWAQVSLLSCLQVSHLDTVWGKDRVKIGEF